MKEFKIKNQPMELSVPFKFNATHSLGVRDFPHEHEWGLKVLMRRKVYDGEAWVADIVFIRTVVEKFLPGGEYLQEDLNQQFEHPTCEHLCRFFLQHIHKEVERLKKLKDLSPDLELAGVIVELLENKGDKCDEWGAVKLMNPFMKKEKIW